MGGAAIAGTPRQSYAMVDPMTVALIASTAINVVEGFVKKGDGGLSAMMRAQFAMLQEIVGQLQAVQESLGRIESAIADLPAQVRDIVRRQYGDELISQIRGGAADYSSFARAYAQNPSVLQNQGVQRQVADILSRAADRRSTLTQLDYGRGPEAAMVLPISLALEVACLAHLRLPGAIIRSRLVDYGDWMDLMTDRNVVGSIPHRRLQAVMAHDAAIDQASSNPLAQKLELSKMKLSAAERVERVETAPCAYLCTGTITTENGDNGPTRIGARKLLGSICPGGYMGSRSVALKEHSQLGVYLLEQGELDMATSWSSAMLGPREGVLCDVRRIPSQGGILELPQARTLQFIRNFYPHMRSEHQVALGATLAKANEQRAEIALTMHAEMLLDHTRRVLADYVATVGA